MATYTAQELSEINRSFKSKLDSYKALNLKLDLTRGKPSVAQLDLSNELDSILQGNFLSDDGTDVRNYGGIDGIPEAKKLFSDFLEVPLQNILIGGNSSLTLMHQYMTHACLFGTQGPDSAWKKIHSEPSFICPSPGYDRHFAICESLGIKMHVVDIDENGPDMDKVEQLIKTDPTVCGMWCVPKYSNPNGVVYSKEVVQRIAALHTIASKEFRIMYDNAYALHDFATPTPLENIFSLLQKTKGENSVVIFGSTSKITFAGAGVAFLATGNENLQSFKHYLSFLTIGPDKVNQLRHTKFFGNIDNLKKHMAQHAKILAPKFDTVLRILNQELSSYPSFAQWTTPLGGYFISLDTAPGLAKKVVSLCDSLGVKLTPAGSTYPYGNDPKDANIRIAPSMPKIEDIEIATKILAAAIGYLASIENN